MKLFKFHYNGFNNCNMKYIKLYVCGAENGDGYDLVNCVNNLI